MKWFGLIAVSLLIVACFYPWVYIESKNITVTGLQAEGTNWGKPGYFHFLMATGFLICNFVQRLWAKRLNLLFGALNLAWAVRNYFVITSCYGGECPEKKWAIYLLVFSSLLMMIAAMFPGIKLAELQKNKKIHENNHV